MSEPSSGPARAGGRRHRAHGRHHRAVVILVWSLAVLLVAGGGGLAYVYFKLNGNLKGVDINAQLGTERPYDVDNGSEDILVLGSDSRAGKNKEYGRNSGTARSDTAMVVHVYKGHKKASVVSIPRDTLVNRPACTDAKGRRVPAERLAMFNSAYEAGGPACAVKTVESMSGIRMDHYIEVDFSGFKDIIDELGGVRITTSRPIDDPKSHLKLAAGTHTLHGEEALGLVRTRHGVGDGSDLGRIQLQQVFVKALISKIKDVGVFSNPKKLFDLADTATSAITPDSQLDSVNSLIGFAGGLKDIGGDNLRMITLPVRYDPSDPNRVLPLAKQSRQVWTALRHDRPVPASATKDSAGDKEDVGRVVKGG